MNLERKSGILLHITSLPGPWGMGELGPQARAFGDFLAKAGQRLWQILPTGPIGYGYSPYSSVSAFAGNHLLISFDELLDAGLLTKRNLAGFPTFDPHTIDFPAVIEAREKILFRVAERFEPSADFDAFCKREAHWLEDYALFMAIREEQGGLPWLQWPADLRDRKPAALKKAAKQLAEAARRHEVLQYLFSCHWKKTAGYFQELGISIVGDIPIFVAGDSADVWANRNLFFLNDDGSPTVVAGVPPDYFSVTGQRWGNPLYNWAVHKKDRYNWWLRRMLRMLDMTDIVRIDHFRGFEAYWEIDAEEPTAMNGHWVQGPGLDLFESLEKQMRKAFGKTFRLADHVIAENLGLITEEVEQLREACGFPGMWVLQFRFGAEDMQKKGYHPEGIEKNWVVYTGTHDNDVTKSWYAQIDEGEQHRVRMTLHIDGSRIHRDLSAMALKAPAKWAILPLQDVIGAGRRMNVPGTTIDNWDWRFSEDMITTESIKWLKEMTALAGRQE